MKKRIYIVEGRFVYVGYGKKINDPLLGDSVEITECYNIRRFGTMKGLSELAYKGKRKDTILDYCPPTIIPVNKIIAIYEVEKKAGESLC